MFTKGCCYNNGKKNMIFGILQVVVTLYFFILYIVMTLLNQQ